MMVESIVNGKHILRVLTPDGVSSEAWREVVGRRQLHSKTYASPDGKTYTMIANVQGAPRHYKVDGLESGGSWLDVDLSDPDDIRAPYLLTRLANKIGYVYQPREPDSPAITVELLAYPLAAKPLNGESPSSGQVYYADVGTDLDIYTQARPYRYGIFKVLKGPDAPRMFRFKVSWTKDPVKATHAKGEIQADALPQAITDGIDNLHELHFDRCYMPARKAWDKDGNKVEVRASIQGEIGDEEVVIPEGFTAWPVTVDTDVTYDAGTNDGYARSTDVTWDDAHDATTATAVSNVSTLVVVGAEDDSQPSHTVYRAMLPIDASALPDDAVISAASLNLYGSVDDSTMDFNLTAVSFDGSSPMVVADFNNFGTTSWGSVTTVGFKLDGYNVLTLNATGRAAISKIAVTLFGLRSSRDISDTEPEENVPEHVEIWSAEKGAGYLPYLAITYTISAEGGSESTVTVSAEGTGSKAGTGSADSTVAVSTEGTGSKTGIGGSESTVAVSVEGAGIKRAQGGAEPSVSIAAEGSGYKLSAEGSSQATVAISAEGSGRKAATGNSESNVTVSAEGAGSKEAAGVSEATVRVSAEGAGAKIYTTAQVTAALHSSKREIRFRYDLLDSSNVFKRAMPEVESGHIELNTFAEIRRTARFSLQDLGTINFLIDRIKPYCRVLMGAGGYEEFPLGVFLLSTPPKKADSAGNITRDVEAYDLLQVLVDDKVATRYTVAAATNYITAVGTILTGAGITDQALTATASTLLVARDWPPGTKKLRIINDLLDAINYRALWFDEDGKAIAQPYVSPSTRASEYTYADDDESVTFPEVVESLDLFGVPNKWLLSVSEPDRATLNSTVTNANATSPTSTVSRGRTIVEVRSDIDAPDQTTLDAIAAKIAYEASQVYQHVEFETAIMPQHSDLDVLTLTFSTLSIDAKFSETGWSFDCKAGARMVHRIRRVVNIT